MVHYLLSCPSENLKEIIVNHWPNEGAVNCSRCGYEVYCSEQCRDAAWEDYHRILCVSFNPAAERLHSRFLEDKQARVSWGSWRAFKMKLYIHPVGGQPLGGR
jgi:hypothetical protein